MSKPREFWALPEKSMGEAKIHGVESVMILCIEKSAADNLVKAIEGEILILETAGAKGSAFGLKMALRNFRGEL